MLSHCSCIWFFSTIACQAPLSMGFSRQEYCCGLPCCLPGDLPDPIKPTSPMSPALVGRFFTTSATWKALWLVHVKAKFLFSVVSPHKVASLYCGFTINEKQYSKCKFTKYLYEMDSRCLSNHRCTGASLCDAPNRREWVMCLGPAASNMDPSLLLHSWSRPCCKPSVSNILELYLVLDSYLVFVDLTKWINVYMDEWMMFWHFLCCL